MPPESQPTEAASSAALTGRRIGLLVALPICFGFGLSFLIFAIQWLQEEQAKLLFIGLGWHERLPRMFRSDFALRRNLCRSFQAPFSYALHCFSDDGGGRHGCGHRSFASTVTTAIGHLVSLGDGHREPT